MVVEKESSPRFPCHASYFIIIRPAHLRPRNILVWDISFYSVQSQFPRPLGVDAGQPTTGDGTTEHPRFRLLLLLCGWYEGRRNDRL